MRGLLLVMLMLVATSPQAAKYYKWVDKDGVVHYDATPPKDQQATEVRAADTKAAPAPEPVPASTEAAPAVAAASTADPAACADARSNLTTLTSNPSISRQDPATGKTVRLSTTEIEAAVVEARQQIEQYCEKAAPAG